MTAAETLTFFEIASNLAPAAVVTFHDVSWEEYEQVTEDLGETAGLRVSYNEGTLKISTLSPEHESYADFIKLLIGHLGFRLRINIRFFGSATMRTQKKRKRTSRMRAFMSVGPGDRQQDSNRSIREDRKEPRPTYAIRRSFNGFPRAASAERRISNARGL